MTDRELDALVAEKVMGWKLKHVNDPVMAVIFANWVDENDVGIITPDEWKPSTDISAAWQVVEKMHALLFSRRREFLRYLQEAVTSDEMVTKGQYIAWPDVFWFITPRAICLAALKAMGVDVERELAQ